MVPADAPTGKQDVVVSNANNASQNGLYIYVGN
jgi:hypothetical protein